MEELSKRVRVEEAYLFGSYARGTWIKTSDVDLVVVSPDFRGMPYLERLDLINEIQSVEVEHQTVHRSDTTDARGAGGEAQGERCDQRCLKVLDKGEVTVSAAVRGRLERSRAASEFSRGGPPRGRAAACLASPLGHPLSLAVTHSDDEVARLREGSRFSHSEQTPHQFSSFHSAREGSSARGSQSS